MNIFFILGKKNYLGNMLIVTYLIGDRTLISARLLNAEVVNQVNVNSYYLFSDPDTFEERFCHIISDLLKFDFALEYASLFFIIRGTVNIETREVIKSELLDGYSTRKVYDGFSFPNAFTKIINRERVFVLDETNAIALSIRAKFLRKSRPKYLVVQLGYKVSTSIVSHENLIDYNSLIRPIKRLQNKDANQLLGVEGIQEVIFSEGTYPEKKYTQNLIDVLEIFIVRAKEEGNDFEGIFIHTQFREYIIADQIIKYFSNIKIHVSNEVEWLETFTRSSFFLKKTQFYKSMKGKLDRKNNLSKIINIGIKVIPVIGRVINIPLLILNLPLIEEGLVKFLTSLIDRIEYYKSTGELKQEILNQYEFRSHWKENKYLSSKDSYYLVHYNDGAKVKVYLGSLNSISDLEKYKFVKK